MFVYKHKIYRYPDIDALYTKERKDFIISKQACLLLNLLNHVLPSYDVYRFPDITTRCFMSHHKHILLFYLLPSSIQWRLPAGQKIVTQPSYDITLRTSGISSLDSNKFWEVEEPPQKAHLRLKVQLEETNFLIRGHFLI